MILCNKHLDGTFALRIKKLSVPKSISDNSIELECDYDLEGDHLFAVKWFKGTHELREEFYRYTPTEKPAMKVFPVPGIKVNVSESKSSISFDMLN